MTDISGLTKLGSGRTEYRYDNPQADMLESFAHGQDSTRFVVGLECSEFTSLCPITGQPDFGRIRIHYIPDHLCVESKSLKLYLGAYRNHGSFHEACVNQIAADLVMAISPLYLRVFGDFSPRGGIAIRPMAVRFASSLTEHDRRECAALIAEYRVEPSAGAMQD
jgi:7-cyano-7-deazaguanine reductase